MIESLRRRLRRDYGMALATYSLAGGFDWDEVPFDEERQRRRARTAVRAHHLLDIPQDQDETVRVICGISNLCSLPSRVLFELSEHLTPGGMSHGSQTDPQLAAIELAHLKSQSLALRSSGNLILFYPREG